MNKDIDTIFSDLMKEQGYEEIDKVKITQYSPKIRDTLISLHQHSTDCMTTQYWNWKAGWAVIKIGFTAHVFKNSNQPRSIPEWYFTAFIEFDNSTKEEIEKVLREVNHQVKTDGWD